MTINWAHNEDSDQTGRMPKLIWDFPWRTGHCVGFAGQCDHSIDLTRQDGKVVVLSAAAQGIGRATALINENSTTCEPRHDKTNKMSVRPAKIQISLGIRPVWSESSLCAQWVAEDPSFLHADSEDSDQIGRMPRLICLRWAHTHFVGFVMSRLMYWR